MSGIYGFYDRAQTDEKNRDVFSEYKDSLASWNTFYGNSKEDMIAFPFAGIGCSIEHLTDAYPAGDPIHSSKYGTAVLDTVLYNRDELCKKISIINSENLSDEELLLRYIEMNGMDSLAEVNGDFSGAIYDQEKEAWILFRDHMGIRPLFFYMDDDRFVFSTDLRGIGAVRYTDMGLNEKLFYDYIGARCFITLCDTEYEKVHCIRPASWVEIKKNNSSGFTCAEHLYWKLGSKKIRRDTPEEYQKELRSLVTDSIQRRLNAVSGMVGCELSGGLDSSVISILVNRLGRDACHFSWSFSPEEFPLVENDEREIVLDICKQENFDCDFSEMPEQHVDEVVNNILSQTYPPFYNSPTLSYGSKTMHARGAKAVLTGHGGDEGVSHRCNPYEMWYFKEYFSYFKHFYKQATGQKLRALRAFKRGTHSLREMKRNLKTAFVGGDSGEFILNETFVKNLDIENFNEFAFFYNPVAFINQGGSRNRLDNIAFQGAENHVRYMVPFLDYRVIDFAVSIPRSLYRDGYENRVIYRRAFDDLLPESLRSNVQKSTASKKEYQVNKEGLSKKCLREKEILVEALNRNFWEKYLDFSKIEAISLSEDYTDDEYTKFSIMMNYLLYCYNIQKTGGLDHQ